MFRWERDKLAATVSEYGRSTEGEAAERWRRSPHYRLLETGESLMRRRVTAETEREFAPFPALWEAAITEFVATVNRFSADGAIGEMDCFYAGWMTDREGGFSDSEVATLERLTPFLGLAIKSASLARIANTLVETYLGRDAGRRVLQGRIARGVADRIKTVLWFSDLRNYVRISESAPPEEIIPLLDDYADAIVSAIHERSGDVLKLIGDGVLAIFPAEDRARACAAALDAADEARASVEAVNERRRADGLPTTDMYLGLRSWRGVLWQHRQQGAPWSMVHVRMGAVLHTHPRTWCLYRPGVLVAERRTSHLGRATPLLNHWGARGRYGGASYAAGSPFRRTPPRPEAVLSNTTSAFPLLASCGGNRRFSGGRSPRSFQRQLHPARDGGQVRVDEVQRDDVAKGVWRVWSYSTHCLPRAETDPFRALPTPFA